MEKTPKGFRLHIGIFGRRNAGKSSLLNSLTRQNVSIVSHIAGTTTDPVEKPMEMLPLGPILFIDTAGVDDVGALGEQRVAKTRKIFDRTDIGLIVVDADGWTPFEQAIFDEFAMRKVPVIAVFNKCDLAEPDATQVERLTAAKVPVVKVVANQSEGIDLLREAIIGIVPDDFLNPPPIIADLVPPGEIAILVVPVDFEAPKGRLILPQVQAIRDLLDNNAAALVVQERELKSMIGRLNRPPVLVVTDSQAFEAVSDATPPEIPMTGFSILFARQKGDLAQFVEGTLAVDRLKPGDRILVAEACTHHPITGDIGREKIPRWLQKHVGGELRFTVAAGQDFPEDLSSYQLVIHCGSCMWNRRQMLARMMHCRNAGVPITNYGMLIAYTLGILERALTPFPEAMAAYRRFS